MKLGPQLIRVLKVVRIVRILRLVKALEDLQKLIQTLVNSIPKLVNVFGLLFLVLFIFSTLGVFLFSNITKGKKIGKYLNFSNFG